MGRLRNWMTFVAGLATAVPAPLFAASPPAPKIETRIIFSSEPTGFSGYANGTTFQDAFLWSGLEKFKKPQDDYRLSKQCFGDPEQESFFGAILGFLVGPLINLATDQIKTSLDDELKKYTAETKASEQVSFYSAAAGKPLRQQWRCFRVTRISTMPSETPGRPVTRTISFDFIGQVQVVGNDDTAIKLGTNMEGAYGLKIRPLRVYMGKPVAKGSSVGVAATISFDAVWRANGEGKRAALFTAPLMEHKFVRDANGVTWSREPYYFPLTDLSGGEDKANFPAWGRLPLQPMVPMSSAGPAGTIVTVTTDFTEVGSGDGKATLKFISNLFAKSQSDLNSAAAKAAKKLIDPDPPAPPAKPELYCGTLTPKSDGSSNVSWTKTDAASCPN